MWWKVEVPGLVHVARKIGRRDCPVGYIFSDDANSWRGCCLVEGKTHDNWYAIPLSDTYMRARKLVERQAAGEDVWPTS